MRKPRSLLFLLSWVLIVALGLFTPSFSNPPSALDQHLSALEQQLFSHSYDSDSPENRVNRLETEVLGAPHPNEPLEKRLQSLDHVLQASGSPPTQAAGGPLQNQPSPNGPPPQADNAVAQEKDGTQYPTVTEMEKRVLHQTFENDTLANRLGRLESRVFGRPQTGSLEDRSDHLSAIVLNNNIASSDPSADNIQTDPGTGGNAGNPSNPNNASANASGNGGLSNADMEKALPRVEKKVLHQTYPQDTVDSRLSRLEMKVFKSTATDMAPEDRLYRIVSVMNAHATPRQDSASNSAYSYMGGGPGYGYGGARSGMGTAAGTVGTMLLMLLMSFL